MPYLTIQIEYHAHLIQTPIDAFDMQEILGLLGFPKDEIAQASITVLRDCITVQWTPLSKAIAN